MQHNCTAANKFQTFYHNNKSSTLEIKLLHSTRLTDFAITINFGVGNSRKNLLVVLSVSYVSYGHRAFSFASPILWNQLPHSIQSCQTIQLFLKKALHTFLFRKSLLKDGASFCYCAYVLRIPGYSGS